MMRVHLSMIFLAFVPLAAHASSSHHCSAPMIPSHIAGGAPQPEFTFRLTLQDAAATLPFAAQGLTFDGTKTDHMKWHGGWINHLDGLQLIGAFSAGARHEEWRAHAVYAESDVMILNVDRGADAPLMIRCLPTDGD